MERLRAQAINTSWLDLSSALLDFEDQGVTAALRISPHYYNTRDELETLVRALQELG